MAHCAFAMLALFLTPMGYRLFELPFVSVDYIQRMVLESRVPRLCDVFAVNITGGVIGFVTASNLLYGLAALCAAASLSGRRARLGHFLLMAGGAYLLTRANRFRYESALLMLPLIEAHPPFGEGLRASKPVRWALGALLVAVTVLSFRPLYRHRPLWPFSWRNLPHGSVAFLKHIDRGGKIWNNPSPGGYLQFELYPRYLIAADMQTPFLFDDKDLYLARESFMDRRLLALALERHRPDFILAPLAQTGFPGLIKDFKDYSLVFFDDVSALYASRKSMPDVVAAYALQEDPFHTTWRFPPPDPAYRGKKMPEFLGRMMAIDPECQNTRWRAARFCLLKGDFQGELAHAEAMIRAYPENYFGHLVKGNALRHLGRLDEAMASLKEALSRSPGEAEVFSHHEMASIYQARGRFKDAVDILRETDDHFPPDSWLMSISTASAQGNALLARPS
jgi:tetratricopeptide (TPR) repeat protein